jgi:DNA polymerase-3 subunit alpha
MTSDFNDTDRLSIEVSECQHMGIEVLSPDINKSFVEFGVVPGKERRISFGLSAIKNVGSGAAEAIVETRGQKPFKSLTDLFTRVSPQTANRKVWESLIKAGALDQFASRGDLLYNLEALLGLTAKAQKTRESDQSDLFGKILGADDFQFDLKSSPDEITPREQLNWERELLGIYLSQHPLDGFDVYLEENSVPLGQLTAEMDNRRVAVAGVITTVRAITTKNGQKMGFVGIMDKTGESELIVFPKIWADSEHIWLPDTVIIGKGKINAKDRDGHLSEVKILLDEVEPITPEMLKNYKNTGKKVKAPRPSKSGAGLTTASTPSRLWLHIKDPDNHEILKNIKRLLDEAPGSQEAVLVLGKSGDNKQALKLPQKVSISSELTKQLTDLVGSEAVTTR